MQQSKATLTAADLDRLQKLCGIFSSDHAGERANAAALADRFLRDHGLRWPDILTAPTLPPPEPALPWWQQAVAECRRRPDLLTAWERAFAAEIVTYANEPSARQGDILRRVLAKVRAS